MYVFFQKKLRNSDVLKDLNRKIKDIAHALPVYEWQPGKLHDCTS